ncbi:MAG: NHL repeat-containing protein [Armatimonadota bacterium]|nr:NHL repeat-containing protein [Armatimonadota bacterium]
MSGNRFEFLEFGENEKQAGNVSETASPTDLPALPAEARGDGTALAQVRVSDPRGYQAFLHEAEDAPSLSRSAHEGAVGLRVVEMFGERGSGAGQFNFPTGIAVDSSGVLFVADSYNHRLQRITPNGGVATIGGRGPGRGQFLSPQGIAVDAQQAFYVVEQGNNRVQKFSAHGVLELVFGKPGRGLGELQGPTGIAVAPESGDIFVADTGNNRIQRFSREGRFLNIVGAAGRLSGPQAVAVDASASLYVADTFAQRVLRYDPLGRLLGQYGGRSGVAFFQPRALAIDPAGLLYVADGGNTTPGSETLGRVQGVDVVSGLGRLSVERPGRGLNPIGRPGGLAMGLPTVESASRGIVRRDVYVADTINHRLLRFAPI